MFVIVALKAQKRIARGRAQRRPGLFHVGDGRAESAKAQITAGYLSLLRFGFYDNRDNRNNGLIVNSMLSVDNNKNNFYQPKGWLPLDPTFTFVALNQRSPAERKGKAQKLQNQDIHFLHIKLYTLIICPIIVNDCVYFSSQFTFISLPIM